VTMVEDGLPAGVDEAQPQPLVLPVGEPRRRPPTLAIVLLSACVGLVGGAAAAWGVYQRFGPVERIVATAPTQYTGGPATPSYQTIADNAAPSVVKILTRPLTAADLAGRPAGFAVGFVVSADGLVVTSAHALNAATRLRVAFADGHAVDASVAGTDLVHGIAVLRAADTRPLQPLTFADAESQAPRPGDLAITVGSPPFAAMSVAAGRISSTGRVVPAAAAGVAGGAVVDVTTIDATADPSEDGAPVLDAAGRVIGVVLAGGDGAPPGVLALSGRSAADLVAAIERGGSARRPTLGVDAVVLEPATAVAVGLRPGALVRAVVPGGPSDTAGLAAGDVVTALDGIPLDAQHPLDAVALTLTEGQRVVLTVVRDGVERTLSVVVGGG
jgi:S1-C subfamily serine protease